GAGPTPPLISTPPRGPAEPSHGYRTAGIVTLVGALGAAGGGLGLNLAARSKMKECYRLWTTDNVRAVGLCDTGKTFAYTSYGLFALAGALGVTSLTLLLWKPADGTTLSFVPSRDGGLLFAVRRF